MNTLDFIIIFVYLAGILLLGFMFKENKSSKDYFLGGQSFGWFPLTLSTMATQISAISFISAPAFVGFRQGGGLKWLTYEFGVPLAMFAVMAFIIPTLYKSGVVSVYEFLERRFDATSRLIISIAFQISRSFGTGVMIYAVAIILQGVLGVDFWISILIIGVITILYCYEGGMKAVIWSDSIQMVILYLGIVLCFIYGLNAIGGWEVLTSTVDRERLQVIDFSNFGFSGDEFGFWPMLFGGIFLYTSYYGTDQTQTQRQLSADGLPTIRKLLIANGLMRFPITLTYCIMGLIVGGLITTDPSFLAEINRVFDINRGTIKSSTDLMIPIFILKYLPHGVIGLLLVAIFSAAMSSLSSTVNSLSAVTMEDIVKRYKPNIEHDQYVAYSKYLTIFWGVICLACAFVAGDIAETVIEAINKIGSVFYGPILAAFILAIFFKKVNAFGANIGIIGGVLLNVIFWLYVPQIFWFWWNFIGAVVTMLLAILLSPYSKKEQKPIIQPVFAYDRTSMLILVGFFILIIILSLLIPTLI